MDEKTRKKLDYIDALLKEDLLYRQMLEQCVVLEKRFDAMVKALPDEDRALAWDFVMLCEDMSRRALEIACMHLPDKK